MEWEQINDNCVAHVAARYAISLNEEEHGHTIMVSYHTHRGEMPDDLETCKSKAHGIGVLCTAEIAGQMAKDAGASVFVFFSNQNNGTFQSYGDPKEVVKALKQIIKKVQRAGEGAGK